ncbi:uncharacterized protein LOC141680148 [Apium graveolens]|uniref:uncharacterized protein LOC141680148 n=1 Tax=Apium graveolens TaxID=4045 RepID=UPI003D793005
MFDQISSLDLSRTTWKIKARVTRMWTSVPNSSTASDAIKGYNLILLDDSDFHVHAYVYPDYWNMHSDKIVEGGVYMFSNFYTKKALGTLKPVSSKLIINFSPTTTVDPVDDDVMISTHKFEFVDLSELFVVAQANGSAEFPEFSTDVIGVLESYEELSKIGTKFGQREIVHFRITDGRDSSKVTVWGNLAIAIDARYKEISKEEPVIVIVTTTKLKIFHTSVQISTLPASKIYLNLDHDVVSEMRQRLREEGYVYSGKAISSSTTQSEGSISNTIHTVTLKELSEKTKTDYLKMNFLCKVKVNNVEESDGWWYRSCSKMDCFGEVTKLEGKYKCSTCNQNNPVPKKKRTLQKLLISSSMTALQNDCSIYYVIDAYDTNGSTSSMSANTIASEISNSVYSDMVEITDHGHTPGSARSTSKKIKLEK